MVKRIKEERERRRKKKEALFREQFKDWCLNDLEIARAIVDQLVQPENEEKTSFHKDAWDTAIDLMALSYEKIHHHREGQFSFKKTAAFVMTSAAALVGAIIGNLGEVVDAVRNFIAAK